MILKIVNENLKISELATNNLISEDKKNHGQGEVFAMSPN